MPTENLTRITLLLPAPLTLRQYYLVEDILTDLAEFCGGITSSQDFPPVFSGRWDPGDGKFQEDFNMLISADARETIDRQLLLDFLSDLKFVTQFDLGQDIIWITLSAIERVTTHDPP